MSMLTLPMNDIFHKAMRHDTAKLKPSVDPGHTVHKYVFMARLTFDGSASTQ